MMERNDVQDAGDIFNPILAANAINVFLGLGLPWTISAIYHWAYNNSIVFLGVEEAITIGWCAFLFFLASCIWVCAIGLRRYCCAHEIGGNFGYICAFFFSFLWVVFIFLCITQNYGHIEGWQPATIRSSTVLADIDG